MRPPLRVVIAGGGTGGHLFPGIAIGQAFHGKNPQSRIRFIGSGRPLEKRVLAEAGFPLSVIPVEGIKGRGGWRQAKVVIQLPLALVKAMGILVRYWPHVVIGVGGYSAGPVVLAARILGRKVVIHEQNRLPGVTTRMLVPLAHGVCVSFGDTPLRVQPERWHLTGNPVRRALLMPDDAEDGPKAETTVVILGGSQGAHGINTAMMAAGERLVDFKGLRIIHQTGEADAAMVGETYTRLGISHVVKPFFNDMGPLYRQADLIVCRAGATTVAELTALGKPALFIPFPAAADDHQRRNAEALVEAHAAEMILEKDLTGPVLAGRIRDLLSDRDRLADMGRQAARQGHPDAADRVAEICYELTLGRAHG